MRSTSRRVRLTMAVFAASFLLVATAAAAASGAPSTLAITVGPELPVTDPVPAPAPGSQGPSDVAWGGNQFLAVWTDARSERGSDIFAARVSANGTVLDPNGLAVTDGASVSNAPAVAWDGTDFLVVWDTSDDYTPGDIRAARVAPDGTVLDPGGFGVVSDPHDQRSPDLTWNGTHFLVVWQDDRSGSGFDVYGARVAPDGAVEDPNGFPVSAAAKAQTVPRVASDGSGWFVAWQDARGKTLDVFGARVDAGGTVLDPGGIGVAAGPPAERTPSLAWDGTDYLVAWASQPTPDRWRIVGARVAPDGTVRDPTGIVIDLTPGAFVEGPDVAWDGVDSLVTWGVYAGTASGVAGARVASDGTVRDPVGIAIERRGAFDPSVAWGGGSWLVTASVNDGATSVDVVAARVGPHGRVLARDLLVTSASAAQDAPAAAWNGSEFLAVWEEARGASMSIIAARLAPDGSTLDPSGIVVRSAIRASFTTVSVASNGSDFLVVWEDFGTEGLTDIFGARIAADGTVIDPSPLVVNDRPGYQYVPAVTWNQSSYLVVFGDQHGVRGARVDPDGTLLDPTGFQIGPSVGYLPNVATGGSSALVIWQGNGFDPTVQGARVAPDGTVLDRTPLRLGARTYSRPSVASDGDGFLVSWSASRGGSNQQVFGNRVDEAGAVLDGRGFVIGGSPMAQMRPSIAWDGRVYLVGFERFKHAGSPDILAARVRPDGSVAGPPIGVGAGPDAETGPFACGGTPGTVSVLYVRRAPEAPYGGSTRVFGRLVTQAI